MLAITKDIIVAAGQKAELSCRVHGKPTPSIIWSRPDLGGKEITPEDSRIQVITTKIRNIRFI